MPPSDFRYLSIKSQLRARGHTSITLSVPVLGVFTNGYELSLGHGILEIYNIGAVGSSFPGKCG